MDPVPPAKHPLLQSLIDNPVIVFQKDPIGNVQMTAKGPLALMTIVAVAAMLHWHCGTQMPSP